LFLLNLSYVLDLAHSLGMANLSTDERTTITNIIHRLRVGSAGKFISANEVEQLTRIFRDKGPFVCGCGQSNSGASSGATPTFQIGMRDEPFVTLLTALLAADAGTL
jgi:hypothetical protein